MGSVMTRLLLFTRLLVLFACWVLAAILLFQGNLSATGYQPQATSRLAQDDGGNAQIPDPATTSDPGNADDSGTPNQDQE